MQTIVFYLMMFMLMKNSLSRQIPDLKQLDEESIVFPEEEESVVELITRAKDPFDESSYTDDENMCLSEQKFWMDGACHLPGTRGPCASNELLYLVKPNNIADDKPLRLICKSKPCDRNEVWWASIQKCEKKSSIKEQYCKGGDRIIKINSFGDAVCTCTPDKTEIKNMEGCHEFYQQGPCESNEVVTYNLVTGYGVCSPDLCSELNKAMDRRRSYIKDKRATKLNLYAPLNGLGQCFKLKSPEPCADIDEYSRFVVDNTSHLPRCSTPRPLYVAFAPLGCRVDDRNMCRKPVHLQQSDRFSFLTKLKHEIFN